MPAIGKVFACIGAVMPGVSVKTDSVETAQMLIDAGVGVRAPYFHRSWVNLPWGTSEDELKHRLTVSYRLIRSSLTKRRKLSSTPSSDRKCVTSLRSVPLPRTSVREAQHRKNGGHRSLSAS